VEHSYNQGWKRYRFEEVPFETKQIHGSVVPIQVRNLFNRGTGQPHISMGVIPPSGAVEAIGMHVHRDLPAASDVEEWYIVIEGRGVMTFSNGDEAHVGPGDLIVIYPGTGHSFRALSEEPVRLISITPVMYTAPIRVTDYPSHFDPDIIVGEVNEHMNPLTAECARCLRRWARPQDDQASATLPVWARDHGCGEPSSRRS
jgi:mannose-6-phosphate isomerase-like protein (cupin superfamily)